jgi:hypothetical protein
MKGTWTTTGGSGGGWGPPVAFVAVAAAAVAIAKPAAHAAGELLRVVLITAGVLAGLVVAAVIAAVAWRRSHPAAERTTAVSFTGHDAARAVQARSAPRELPPAQQHIHFHGVSAEDVAEIINRTRKDTP